MPTISPHDFQADIDAVGRIDAVSTILDVVCRSTGMGFAAVARVTEERWIACQVLDNIHFGLEPGGELKVESTICHEIRQNHQAVIINCVAENPTYRDHHTPRQYGFQSYISMPIVLKDGTFFGTLCAIDPRPARLENPETIGMFKLFAELIAAHPCKRMTVCRPHRQLSQKSGSCPNFASNLLQCWVTSRFRSQCTDPVPILADLDGPSRERRVEKDVKEYLTVTRHASTRCPEDWRIVAPRARDRPQRAS
jgi:hypothetical protein